MFCGKCGSKIDDNTNFCTVCGNPVTKENPATPTETAPQTPPEIQTPPVTETTPVTQAPPVTQATPVVETPVYVQQSAAQPDPVAKAKNKTNIIAGIIAVAILVVIGVAALFGAGKVKNTVKKTFSSKEDYLVYVTQNKADEFAADIAEALGTVKENSKTEAGAKGEVKLKLTKDGADFLKNFVMADLSWAKEAVITIDEDVSKDKMSIKADIGLNGTNIVSAECIVDLKNYMLYIKIPDVSSEFIKVSLGKMSGTAAPEGTSAVISSVMDQTVEALPDSKLLEKILSRYVGIALSAVDDVNKESDTLEVGNVTLKCDKYTVEIDGELLKEMITSVLKEAKKDKDLEKIIKDAVKAMDTLSADEDEVYDDFIDSIDDILENLDESEVPEEKLAEYVCWVNGSGDIMGIELDADGTTVTLLAPEKGKNFAIDLKVKSGGTTVSFEGEGTKSGNKKSGEFKIRAMGMDIVEFTVEDFDTKTAEDGYFNGSITVELSSGFLSMMGITESSDSASVYSILSDMKLKLDMESSKKKNTALYTVSLIKDGDELFSFGVSGKEDKYNKIDTPKKALDTNSSADMQKWAEKLDIKKFIDRLTKAGAPEDLFKNILG